MPGPFTRKALQDRPVPEDLVGLHRRLQPISGVLIRHSLRLLGLQVPSVMSVSELSRLVVAYVEDGALGREQALEMALDCVEYSGKRAYLYEADTRALNEWLPPDSRQVVRRRADVVLRPAAGPDERTQYVWTDGDLIRICLSEGHTYFEQDRRALTLVPRVRPRYIVVEANRRTGAVTLFMDPPGQQNPHGSALAYKRFYQERMAALLGTTPTTRPLSRALGRLEDQHVIEITHSRAETEHGRMALTGGLSADIRTHPQYAQLRASRINYDEDEYIWLPQPSGDGTGLTIPVRPLKTYITAMAGEVRFTVDALAREVEYVLGQLRATA